MHPRYAHPQVTTLYSDDWTYAAWFEIERTVLRAQFGLGIVDIPPTSALLNTEPEIDDRAISDISIYEAKMKHDVAAFVAWLRDWYGEPGGRWIHFGLTSSDLVDTAQGMRFKKMGFPLATAADELTDAVSYRRHDQTVMLGRTHGQPAQPTTMAIRAAGWLTGIYVSVNDLMRNTRVMQVAKISGPVGTYNWGATPEVERMVARDLLLTHNGPGATQITNRGYLSAWADSAARVVEACAKIAMDIRLLTMTGEAYEPHTDGQVGSSSMAHKNNPIRAEQITGLARVARSFATMLAPIDLWLERDISNSSVERIAVPDLWHVTMHAMEQTTKLVTELRLNDAIVDMRLEDNANAAFTMHTQMQAIMDGMSYADAREFTLTHDFELPDTAELARTTHLAWYPKDDG